MRIETAVLSPTQIFEPEYQYHNLQQWYYVLKRGIQELEVRIVGFRVDGRNEYILMFGREHVFMVPNYDYQIWDAFFKLCLDHDEEI